MAIDRLFTDARVYLPGGSLVDGWLAVEDGKVASIGESTPPTAATSVDCGGQLLLPGLVDMHVHFRDPGFTHKEDFSSGSLAAAFGGVTTVIDMPNTGGFVRTPADVEHKLARIQGRSYVDYGLYALLADSAPDVTALRAQGVVGLKWLMGYPNAGPSNRVALRDALAAAADADLLVGVHAESLDWITDLRGDLQRHDRTDALAHGESRPPFVEALGVAEAAILTREAGCRLHIHHLSSAFGLETASRLRTGASAAISLETCPHYLYLTEDDVRRLGSRARVNPPIRTQTDVDALWSGIATGAIQCVATDHAPHTPKEKVADDIWQAESGLPGVETLFPMLFHEVSTGRLTLRQFVELTAERPAAIAGLHRKGNLLPGADADLVLVDPRASTTLRSERLHSKHPFTVFEGLERSGRISGVYLRGEPVVEDDRLVAPPRGGYVAACMPGSPRK